MDGEKFTKIGKYVTNTKLSIETTQAFLSSILENSREVIYRYNFQTQQYDFISDSIETLTGYTSQEILRRGADELIQSLHPDDESRFMKFYLGLINNTIIDSTVELEYRVRHKKGNYIWLNDLITIIRDENGKIQAIVGAIRDITLRKQWEQELKVTQERFKILSDATFEGVCIHDQGQILDVNQNFLKMFGIDSMEEVKGTECYEFIPPKFHKQVGQYISKGEKGPYEILALKADGTSFPIQVRARECLWKGNIVRIATFRDLTDQKNMELELKKSRDRFKHLFEHAPDAIFIADVETGIIVETNSRASELLGIPAEEIIGMHHTKLHPPEEVDKYKAIFRNHIRSDAPRILSKDIYVQHKDGRKIPIQINASIVSINDHKFIFGLFRDITEQKKLMRDIANREAHFKRLSEAAFEAIAIHEQGNIVDVNHQYLDMFGYTLEEVRATPGIEMIASESRALVEEKMASKYEGAYKAFAMKKDGTIFPVEIQAKESVINGKPIRIGAIRDMTEQMQQAEQFKAVFESSKDCIALYDKDFNYLYMNQTAKDFAKTVTNDVPTDNLLDSIPYAPEFFNTWKNRIANVFITGNAQDFVDTFTIGDQTIHSEATLSPIRYPGSEIFAVSLVFRDVSELKGSELRYKRLAEATFEGIAIHDFHNYLEANEQFLDMFGYTLKELKELEDGTVLIAPDCRERVIKLAESKYEEPYEVTCQRKDGSLFPAEFHARHVTIDNTSCRIVAARDLTTYKQLVRDLADSKAKYKELYNNAKAALYRARTDDGKLLACSKAMAKIHGYNSVEECINKHHGTNHYVDKGRRKQLLEQLYKNKRVENFEYHIYRADGKIASLSLNAEIFPEMGWIEGVVKDITPSKVLTQTEMKVLRILLAGKSNKEIAFNLNRSVRTIEDHRSHIMQKLEVDNIVDLTRKALQYGINPYDKSP